MPWSYCSAVRKHVERTDFFSQGNERQSQTASGSWPRSKHCRGEAEMEGCLALNQEPWLNSMHCNNQRHWDLLKYHHQELHFREKSFSVTHLFQCVTIKRHLSITVCTFILKALLFLLKIGLVYSILQDNDGAWWFFVRVNFPAISCHPSFSRKFVRVSRARGLWDLVIFDQVLHQIEVLSLCTSRWRNGGCLRVLSLFGTCFTT